MGYITLQTPGSVGTRARSFDQEGIVRTLFPGASENGIGFEDIPFGARTIAKFISGPQNGVVSRLVSSQGIKTNINYDLHAVEFNRTFWLRNFIKCLAVARLTSFEMKAQSRFIDVGGGAGAFSLAAAEVADNARITIHDSSRAQERLFKELRRHELMPQKISFQHQRVSPSFLARTKTARLFSYALCENQELISTKARALDTIGDFAVIVDYWQVIETIAEAASSAGSHTVLVGRIELPLESKLARTIGQDTITVSGGLFQK